MPEGTPPATPSSSCVFCGLISGDPGPTWVLDETDVVAFLDIRPVFKGHVLVVPRRHHETLPDLPSDQLPTFFAAVQGVAAAIPEALGAGGTFVAVNNRVSQSVPHLHAHVVPRTKGDGLRGFFWPRQHYTSPEEMAEVAGRIRSALGGDD